MAAAAFFNRRRRRRKRPASPRPLPSASGPGIMHIGGIMGDAPRLRQDRRKPPLHGEDPADVRRGSSPVPRSRPAASRACECDLLAERAVRFADDLGEHEHPRCPSSSAARKHSSPLNHLHLTGEDAGSGGGVDASVSSIADVGTPSLALGQAAHQRRTRDRAS